jgi:hypothetical protein
VFGGFGIGAFLLGMLSAILMFYYKFSGQKSFIETPLPLVTVMFFLVGCLSLLLGLVAELTIRTYYESQGKRTYAVRSLEERE